MTIEASFDHRRILVIDDNDSIHADIMKTLCPESNDVSLNELERGLFGDSAVEITNVGAFRVDSAYRGEDGLALVEKAIGAGNPYSLAFVDMRMPPGWDGVETIDRIWRVDPEIQIIICSAYSDRNWTEMIEVLGRTDRFIVLKKPFETIEVQQATTALAEKWKLARRAKMQLANLDQLVAERTAELSAANDALKTEVAVRMDTERQLHRMAHYDALTDLPNRPQLLDLLGTCKKRSVRNPDFKFGVMFIDLDNFKVINDSLGHEAGDDLLVEVASRIAGTLRTRGDNGFGRGTTARLGGDEFVVVLEEIENIRVAVNVAEQLQSALATPIEINGHNVTISASIGIVMNDASMDSAGDLLRSADTAMYCAKMSGKSNHAVYDDRMHQDVLARLTLENALRSAIERQELFVEYQPIVSLSTGYVAGFEALLRWRRPDGEIVPPAIFIPIAEEIGIINEMGNWVMREAIQTISKWNADLPVNQHVYAAVNVARQQLESPAILDEIRASLNESGLAPELLHIEVTESAVIDAPDDFAAALRSIRESGVSVDLDDFGTGYSSLSCLYDYPLDAIKIDRSFVYQSEKHREYAAVIASVMLLARNLRIQVVAEGIETMDQLAQILAFDCDLAQGFCFSQPLPPDEARAMVAAGKRVVMPKPSPPIVVRVCETEAEAMV